MINAITSSLMSTDTVLALLLGVFGGMFMGAMPGLSATMAMTLFLPLTYTMDPGPAIMLLMSTYTAAIYGGSITAILIHTPGTPSSAATALDGYKLTQKGMGLQALGVSTVASSLGSLVGAVALICIAPPLARFALKFSDPEYFLIAIFGLTIIGSLAGKSTIKGLISGAVGLCIAVIGVDPVWGYLRLTFGTTFLQSGIATVPAMIGLFSIAQVMTLAEKRHLGERESDTRIHQELKGRMLPSFSEFIRNMPQMIRSAIIGVVIGILPGAGGDIAGWVSYNEGKRFSKHPEEFGEGCLEALYCSEGANNAVVGGAMIPLLTLGIPGSAACAVCMGALMIHGVNPGFTLFEKQMDMVWVIVIGFVLASLLMAIVGVLTAKHVVRIADLSAGILAPLIVVLSLIGAYAINLNYYDVYVMLAFGVLGYLMRKFEFPTAPVVLALILGNMAEGGLIRSIIICKGNLAGYIFGRPLCVFFIILIILSLFAQTIGRYLGKLMQIKKDTDVEIPDED